MKPVVVERSVACVSAPHALWCVITDTERLNRAIGLGPIELRDNDDRSAARYLVSTVSGGFPLQYEERPYEWVENERFRVRRVVRRGAAKTIDNDFSLGLRPGGGTDVTIRIVVEPRYVLLAPFIRVQVRRFVDRIAAELTRLDRALADGRADALDHATSRVHPGRLESAMERLRAGLPEAQREVARRLREVVVEEPDTVVDRIRPYELADAWELDRRVVLATCLRAVEAGLLELSWDLICPSCVTAADRLRSLETVGESGHCQLCDITFDLSLDEAVEATFRPSAGLRRVDAGPYCVGGPARTPHVVTQAIIAADGEATLKGPRAVGPYQLFLRGGARASLTVREGGAAQVAVEVTPETTTLGEHVIAPGAEVLVRQRRGTERHVKIERVGWTSRAASAAAVATLPEFRRSFSGEVLRKGVSLKVGRVALLFTDLTASTQLYRDVGDAGAFDVVQEHFTLLEQLIAHHRGAVVKTMGDAVMAVFGSESDAIEAALACQRAFADFRARYRVAERCYLKIGLMAGPCYAVTANDLLDYFGQTVNVTARLQAAARAGEIVMTEAAWRAEGAALLAGHAVEPFEADLKGVGRVPAVRVLVDVPSGALHPPRSSATP